MHVSGRAFRAITIAIAFVNAGTVSTARAEPVPASNAVAVMPVSSALHDIAVFPKLGILDVISGRKRLDISNTGALGTSIDAYALSDRKHLVHLDLCPIAVHVTPDVAAERLIVTCASAEGAAIMLVDARRTSIVARIDIVADVLPGGRGRYDVGERKDGALVILDAHTGAIVHIVSVPRIVPVAGLAFLTTFARSAIVGLNGSGFTFAIDLSAGSLTSTAYFGRDRRANDAVFDGTHVFSALANAGSLARFRPSATAPDRFIPVGREPMQTFLDPITKDVITLCRGDNQTDLELVRTDADGAHAKTLRIPIRSIAVPYEIQEPSARFDDVSRRIVVASGHQISVIGADLERPEFSIDLGARHVIDAVDLDSDSGALFVAYRSVLPNPGSPSEVRSPFDSLPQSGILTFGIRAGQPEFEPVSGAGELVVTGGMAEADLFAFAGFSLTPPHIDPPGLRSPRWIAFDQSGVLVVAEASSPTIARFDKGVYVSEPIAVEAPPTGIAPDANGAIWFPEADRTGNGTIVRRDRSGAIRRFSLPPQDDAHRTVVAQVAPARDGVWYARGSTVGRVSSAGSVSEFPLAPSAASAPSAILAIASRPVGGLEALLEDRLAYVDDDGHVRIGEPLFGFDRPSALLVARDGTTYVALPTMLLAIRPDGSRRSYFPELAPTPGELAAPVTTPFPEPCILHDLVEAADGSIWGACADTLKRVDLSGHVRAFTLTVKQSAPTSLAAAPDGTIWFAEPMQSKIGHIDSNGTIVEVTI